MAEKIIVELIAMMLLAPLIWSFDGNVATQEPKSISSAPLVQRVDGQMTIAPPLDKSLTMIVSEVSMTPAVALKPTEMGARAPASSVESVSNRRIDVIVSAP